jgi:hypothetical protein
VPDLATQRRIAARLDISLLIARQSAIAASGASILASRLANALVGRRVEQLGLLAPRTPLGDLVLDVRNGLYKPEAAYGSGTPVMRIFNIAPNGGWSLARTDLVNVTSIEGTAYELRVGDLLLSRVNSSHHVGKTALVDHRVAGAVFEAMTLRVRLDTQRVLPSPLLYH